LGILSAALKREELGPRRRLGGDNGLIDRKITFDATYPAGYIRYMGWWITKLPSLTTII
jgi:hypothetical protein